MKLELWSYDVLGNEADGYEVNDRCCLDKDLWNGDPEEVPQSNRDAESYLLHLIDAGPDVAVDWSASGGGTFELTDRRNGKPLGQIVEVDK